jgi:hypothetical protein
VTIIQIALHSIDNAHENVFSFVFRYFYPCIATFRRFHNMSSSVGPRRSKAAAEKKTDHTPEARTASSTAVTPPAVVSAELMPSWAALILERLDRMDSRFDRMDSRFDAVERRLATVETAQQAKSSLPSPATPPIKEERLKIFCDNERASLSTAPRACCSSKRDPCSEQSGIHGPSHSG